MAEMIDIIDENDNVVDTVPYKEMREKNLWHRGSHVYVFNSNRDILVTKRTDDRPKYPGFLNPLPWL